MWSYSAQNCLFELSANTLKLSYLLLTVCWTTKKKRSKYLFLKPFSYQVAHHLVATFCPGQEMGKLSITVSMNVNLEFEVNEENLHGVSIEVFP